MVNNLFSNSMKYNVASGWVELSAANEAGTINISFSNPCLPLPDNFSEMVFERFYRGDLAGSRKIDGTGLGLSLCREIAIASNGQLEFSVINQDRVIANFRAPAASVTV